MLNEMNLKDQIITGLSKLNSASQLHDRIAFKVMMHLIKNLQITGTYTGIIPSVPPAPDPSNGPVKFKLILTYINGKLLLTSAKKGMPMWYKNLCKQISTTSLVNLAGGKVFLSNPIPIFTPIVPSTIDIKNSKSLDETWGKIAKILIKDIKNSRPVSISIPAISAAGGTGMVVFSKFS